MYERSAVDADRFPLLRINFEIDGWDEISETVMNFNSEVWRLKKEQGLSLNSEIPGVQIPEELHMLSVPLKRMHKLTN